MILLIITSNNILLNLLIILIYYLIPIILYFLYAKLHLFIVRNQFSYIVLLKSVPAVILFVKKCKKVKHIYKVTC